MQGTFFFKQHYIDFYEGASSKALPYLIRMYLLDSLGTTIRYNQPFKQFLSSYGWYLHTCRGASSEILHPFCVTCGEAKDYIFIFSMCYIFPEIKKKNIAPLTELTNWSCLSETEIETAQNTAVSLLLCRSETRLH